VQERKEAVKKVYERERKKIQKKRREIQSRAAAGEKEREQRVREIQSREVYIYKKSYILRLWQRKYAKTKAAVVRRTTSSAERVLYPESVTAEKSRERDSRERKSMQVQRDPVTTRENETSRPSICRKSVRNGESGREKCETQDGSIVCRCNAAAVVRRAGGV